MSITVFVFKELQNWNKPNRFCAYSLLLLLQYFFWKDLQIRPMIIFSLTKIKYLTFNIDFPNSASNTLLRHEGSEKNLFFVKRKILMLEESPRPNHYFSGKLIFCGITLYPLFFLSHKKIN